MPCPKYLLDPIILRCAFNIYCIWLFPTRNPEREANVDIDLFATSKPYTQNHLECRLF